MTRAPTPLTDQEREVLAAYDAASAACAAWMSANVEPGTDSWRWYQERLDEWAVGIRGQLVAYPASTERCALWAHALSKFIALSWWIGGNRLEPSRKVALKYVEGFWARHLPTLALPT